MPRQKLAHVDLDTGELMPDGCMVYVPVKRKNGFTDGWCAMAQSAFGVMKQFKRVEDFRVLMALLEKLDFENLIHCNQAEIARDLDMAREQVNRAIKRLVEAEVVIEGPRVGVNRTYRLSPRFAWKGAAKHHLEALESFNKPRIVSNQEQSYADQASR